MVRCYPSFGNCTKALLDSEPCSEEVRDYEPEPTSSADPIPTVTLANGVEMPLLGLGRSF
ncbi:hypothetical protein OESDEN_18732 [Oesophagostomum dentatum]|uniref:Uncharacterized protein n=1 Tax=Oesophagostomum dentatum TaxID=61180 RepID=A0A0B1SCH5_OESDE|nr:hypothetical protein OESDEN_18732 [Oesophagostomum dentatum]